MCLNLVARAWNFNEIVFKLWILPFAVGELLISVLEGFEVVTFWQELTTISCLVKMHTTFFTQEKMVVRNVSRKIGLKKGRIKITLHTPT